MNNIIETVRRALEGEEDSVQCVVTGKERTPTPEERVRQALASALMADYGYRRDQLWIEFPIPNGHRHVKADIVAFYPGTPHIEENVFMVAECKKQGISDAEFNGAVEQLESYMNLCRNVRFGVVCDGARSRVLARVRGADGSIRHHELDDVPTASEALRVGGSATSMLLTFALACLAVATVGGAILFCVSK